MTAINTVSDVYCVDLHCPASIQCSECTGWLCPAHSDQFTSCVDNDEVLHHVDCEAECIECSAANAYDAAEERYERDLREGP